MSNEERQRILREAGSAPAEAEKADRAKSSREAATKDAAAEASEADGAREPDADATAEPADAKVKRRGRRARRARAAAETGDRDPAEGGSAHREQLEREVEADRSREAERGTEAEPGAETERPAEADADRAEDAEEEAGSEEEAEERRRGRVRGRRRAAETSTSPRAATERSPDGAVAVRAKARYVHCAPRKARLVIQHIRGKSVDEARAILRNTPRGASRDVLKLLESCVANAENNHELAADELKVGQAVVDEGPTIKRYRPRALGRATRIRKRTSHMTITLTPKE